MHTPMSNEFSKVEVITGVARRRRGIACSDRSLDGGLQHRASAFAAGLPLTTRIHSRLFSTRRVSGLTGSTPILEKDVGLEHPSVAIILNNLALTYAMAGDYSNAERL